MTFIKNKKRIILLVLIFIGILSINQNVFAKGANISISPSSPKVGDTVTVTVTVSDVHTCTANVNVSGSASGSFKVVGGDMGGNKSNVSANSSFQVTSEGNISVNVSGNCIIDGNKEDVTGSASVNVSPKPTPTPEPTAKPTDKPNTPTPTPIPTKIPTESDGNNNNEEPKSSNNHLKSLSINVGKLQPSFNRENTNYTVEFEDGFDLKGLKSIKVSGEKENDKATVTGLGENALEEGENTIAIAVKAENGAVRTYNIKIVKPISIKQSDLRIKSLEINKINKENKFIKTELNEEFSPDQFEYTLDVDKNIIALDITPKLEKDDIIVNIEGVNNLQPGENLIKITLMSRDDETIKTVYTIKVNKEKIPEEITKTDGEVTTKKPSSFLKGPKSILLIIIGIIAVLVIALVALIIVDNKNKKKMEAEEAESSKKGKKNKADYNVFEDKETKKTQEKSKESSKSTKGRGKRFN